MEVQLCKTQLLANRQLICHEWIKHIHVAYWMVTEQNIELNYLLLTYFTYKLFIKNNLFGCNPFVVFLGNWLQLHLFYT